MTGNRIILIEFGKRIQELRKSKSLSQEKLAHKAGLHRTYIGMIERGEKNITLINIYRLSQALEVEVMKLFIADAD
ncbi:transcriptional regulator [Lewinellaceae bacterium SD302]|nr:transcriptional regulator [Lewinellaceae bacterium SD302]